MKFPYTVAAVVLSLVLAALAFAAGALTTGLNAASTPIVVAVLAMVSGMIPGLLALLKSEQTNRNVDRARETIQQVQEDLGNGVMEAHVINAVRKANGEEVNAIHSQEG